VREQHGAQSLPHLEGAAVVSRRNLLSGRQEVAGSKPVGQRSGGVEVFLALLEVGAVHELLHDSKRLGRALLGSGLRDHGRALPIGRLRVGGQSSIAYGGYQRS
jgi:hypothetical protein